MFINMGKSMRCGSSTLLYEEINAVRVFYMFIWGNKCGAVRCGSSVFTWGNKCGKGLLIAYMGKSMRCGAGLLHV